MKLPSPLRNWLLSPRADPSVRLRVYRELLGRPETDPSLGRARKEVGKAGWVAGLLARQWPDGHWMTPGSSAGELYRPVYAATNSELLALAELGATREDPRVARAAELLLDRWGEAIGGRSSHLCITGNVVRMMERIGYHEDPRVQRGIGWLVDQQKADGGWHCFPSRTGTLDAWEALAALASIPMAQRTPAVGRAIERGAEFYLERRLMKEGSRYEPWFRLHYPNHYYYDLLVGLNVLTSLGHGEDRRLRPALEWLESRRRPDGRWPMDVLHPDVAHPTLARADVPEDASYGVPGIQPPYFALGFELPGQASRWITTTALAVLSRSARA